MKVMIYLGSKATAKVIQGLKSMSDDIDYMAYTSVSNFVQEAEARHLSFNRVVFNNKFLPNGEDDYIRLNDFIHSFSSATELVMVINDGDKVNEDLFNKYFSSPMHSCAIVKNSASMDFFRDIVSLPISDVKARYYTLDKSSGGSVTSKSVGAKMGEFRGGSKKSVEPKENSLGASTGYEIPSKKEISSSDFIPGLDSKNVIEPVVKPVSSPSGSDFSSADFERSSDFSNNVPVSVEPVLPSSKDFSEEDEEDILSVGAFGSAHSDTDMFDEEDEPDELCEEPQNNGVSEEEQARRAAIEEQNRIAERMQEEARLRSQQQKPVEVPTRPKATPAVHARKFWPALNGTPYEAYNVNIVVSAGNASATQRIVDDSVRMMESGMRVLIVDMDFIYNGILAFIDYNKYYKGNHNAYSGGGIYIEEGIGVITGGYGFTPSKEDILKVLSVGVISKFDIVIVDCPVSSIKLLEDGMLEKANIIIFSDSDPSQVIVTSLALTDRSNCSLYQERLIMSKGKPLLTEGKEELLKNVVDGMFFANGCWLK